MPTSRKFYSELLAILQTEGSIDASKAITLADTICEKIEEYEIQADTAPIRPAQQIQGNPSKSPKLPRTIIGGNKPMGAQERAAAIAQKKQELGETTPLPAGGYTDPDTGEFVPVGREVVVETNEFGQNG